jgi:hypothetical protein
MGDVYGWVKVEADPAAAAAREPAAREIRMPTNLKERSATGGVTVMVRPPPRLVKNDVGVHMLEPVKATDCLVPQNTAVFTMVRRIPGKGKHDPRRPNRLGDKRRVLPIAVFANWYRRKRETFDLDLDHIRFVGVRCAADPARV